jgi:hypothetical protein
MASLENTLREWVKQYELTVNADAFEGIYAGQSHEIEDSLFSLFCEHGSMQYAEMGTSPSEYLPSLISDYLGLLSAETWKLSGVTSNDRWETAQVELSHINGDKFQFNLDEVNDSDWVPADLAPKMQKFSAEKADQTLMTFYSDDPYVIVALQHEAAKELEVIIDEYAEPYD